MKMVTLTDLKKKGRIANHASLKALIIQKK